MSFPTKGSIEQLANRFLNENVKTVEEAIQGSCGQYHPHHF